MGRLEGAEVKRWGEEVRITMEEMVMARKKINSNNRSITNDT